jgi:hypothetical protein
MDGDLRQVRRDLELLKRRSTEVGAPTVEKVATAAQALMEVRPRSAETEREVLETVSRSLDLMTLLVDDASRRRQGYPPAALHEAVHALFEQMERIRPGIAA